MTDRPIIFSAPMIRALLDGRKTQDRRVLKPQPVPCLNWGDPPDGTYPSKKGWSRFPYGTGDCLYVREAWRTHLYYDDLPPSQMSGEETIVFESDHPPIDRRPNRLADGRYRHARFMPRWASRMTLTVTDVRVQRLQNISEADAVAEGIEMDAETGAFWGATGQGVGGATRLYDRPGLAFHDLWNSLHGPDAWAANPWVVAPTFDVHRCNIDRMKG